MDSKTHTKFVGTFPTCDALHRRLGVVKNEQGFSHEGRMRVKKLVPLHRRRDAVQNVQGFPHEEHMRVKKLVPSNGFCATRKKLRIGS